MDKYNAAIDGLMQFIDDSVCNFYAVDSGIIFIHNYLQFYY